MRDSIILLLLSVRNELLDDSESTQPSNKIFACEWYDKVVTIVEPGLVNFRTQGCRLVSLS